MNRRGFKNGQRGVSEIYGTVLIISLALVTALILVGVGMVTMQEITSDTEDDTAKQAVVELDNRIEEVTDSTVDSRTTMVFPEGTGTDVTAKPDQGNVTINVTTEDEYWHGSTNPGDLVDAQNQTDNSTIKLGSIVHEDGDGVETAVQGGGVWRKEDGTVSMVSSPNLNLAGDSLQLSFVNLSSIELVEEGEELTIQKNTTSSSQTSDKLQKMIREHMSHDGQVVAEANVTITIESQYAEGWANYVEDMDGVDSSNVTMVDDTTVEIEFGTFGDGMANMSEEFDDDIIYTGLADFAPALYNDTEGTLDNFTSDPGYEVSDPADPAADGGYRVGILYDHFDDGRDWWVWNDTSGKWQNIENASQPTIAAGAPDTVEAVNNNTGDNNEEFKIKDRAWTCAVNVTSGSEFRDYVPNETQADNGNLYGCLQGPKGVENPDDHAAEYEALYEIEQFRTNVVNINDKSDAGINVGGDVVINNHQVNVSIKVSNSGTKNGSQPLALLIGNETANPDWGPQDPKIQDGNPTLEVERGNTTWYNTTVEPKKSWLDELDSDNKFELGAGTSDDAVEKSNRPYYKAVLSGSSTNFTIDSINWVADGVDEGEDVVVNATIRNNGTKDESGVVRLAVFDDNNNGEVNELLNYTEKTIPSDYTPSDANETKVNLTWHTGQNAKNKNQSVYVLTDTDEKLVDPVVNESTDNSEFEIEELWSHEDLNGDTIEEGQSLEVRANITNSGSEEATKTVVLKNESTGTVLGWNETKIQPDAYRNVTFEWNTDVGDDGPHTLTVNTSDNDDTVTVNIDESTTATNFQIEEMVPNETEPIAGQTVSVAVNVTNIGDAGSKNVWLEDLNGEPVDINTSLNLAKGESAAFNFTWDTDSADVDGNARDFIRVNSTDGQNKTALDVKQRDPPDSDFNVTIEYTNASVSQGQSIFAGQNLTVNVTVHNEGDSKDKQSVVLENINGTVVDILEFELGKDEQKQRNLTWRTIVGNSDEGYVNVSSEDRTDGEKVKIKKNPRELRDPADVMFVLDESGSMGAPRFPGQFPDHLQYDANYSDASLIDDNPSGTRTVEEGEILIVSYDCGFWSGCSYDYYGGGEEIDFSQYSGQDPELYEYEEPYSDAYYLSDLNFAPSGTQEVPADEVWKIVDDCGGIFGCDTTWFGSGTEVDLDDYSLDRDDTTESLYRYRNVSADFDPDGTETVPDGEFWKVYEADGTEHWFTGDDTVDYGNYDFDESDANDGVYKYRTTDVRDIEAEPSGQTEVPDDEVWVVCDEDSSNCDPSYSSNDIGSDTSDWSYYVGGQTVDFGEYDFTSSKQDDWVVKYDIADGIDVPRGAADSAGYDGKGDRVRAVWTAVSELNSTLGDRAGLTEYEADATTYLDLTDSLQTVNETVRIDPGGGTDITDGMIKAEEELEDPDTKTGNDKYMILLTDGKHEQGPRPENADINETIDIYTVGFGDADNATLETIAQESGNASGKFYWAENSSALAEIFEDVIGSITKPDTPQFSITDVKNETIQVEEGQTVDIMADINNTGAAPGEQFVTLTDFEDLYVDSWSENLTVHQEETPTFSWNTKGVINWSQQSNDYVNKTVTIQTPSDNETVYVNISRKEADILPVTIDTNASDSEDESIQEEDVMKVDVGLQNFGDGNGTTGVWLYGKPGGEFLAGTSGIQVNSSETENVVLNWTTEAGDHEIDEVEVITDYAGNIVDENVNITESDTLSSTDFDLNITSTNASTSQGESIVEGQFLNVSVNVTNVGSERDGTTVMLYDIGNKSIVDIVEVSELDPGEYNDTVELAWNTSVDDGPQTGQITVETWTGEFNDTEQVEITGVGTPNVDYQIQSISTNAKQASPLSEGDTLEVDVEIKNDGETPNEARPVVLKGSNGNIGNITDVNISAGNTDTITIDWVNVPAISEINVSADSGNDKVQGHDVYIKSTTSAPDIDIDSITPVSPSTFPDTRDEAADAGEDDIVVDVEVENNGGSPEDIFVALYAEIGGTERLVAVEKKSSVTGTATATLTWETTPRQGSDDDNWEIWAEARSAESSKLQVYLDVPEGLNPGGPAFGGGESGVDIDIGEIEVG